MRVSVIKDNKIRYIILPEKISGNYWVSELDKNGNTKNIINIESNDSNWTLVSNDEFFCYGNSNGVDVIVERAILQNYKFYYVKNSDDSINYILYCSPTQEKYNRVIKLDKEEGKEYFIGNNNSCIVSSPSFQGKIASIRLEKNKLIINPLGVNEIFVNSSKIVKETKLEYGDIIFIYGIRIVPVFIDGNYYLQVSDSGMNLTIKNMVPDFNSHFIRDDSVTEPVEDIEMQLYDESDYFHKVPRFIYEIKDAEMNVDPQPGQRQMGEQSLLLTMGPMITMGMSSVMTGYMALNNVFSGKATWSTALPSLVMCFSMMASMFMWPLIRRAVNKKNNKKYEKLRRKKYNAYIEEKRQQIRNEIRNQEIILKSKYPSGLECQQIILNKMVRLWERNIEDEDFLSVALGYGNLPLQLNIKFPEEHFSLEEDVLKESLRKLKEEPKLLSGVPIAFSFLDNNIFGVIGNETDTRSYFDKLLLQFVMHHSYDDLKIAVFTDDSSNTKWQDLKVLPHCWNNEKSVRYIASNNDEYKELCYHFESILNARKEIKNKDPKAGAHIYDTIYLIVIDSYKAVRNYDFINTILESKQNYGFSLIFLEDKVIHLPEQCKVFANLIGDKGELARNIANEKPLSFTVDNSADQDFYACAKVLANTPMELKNDVSGQLPQKVGFLEMFDIGKVESFNCRERWKNNNPIINLQAPVGIGKNGSIVNIDLHEKYHGPHGIIAGMTGSGKSEFIITYILSMAVNFHPYEVQFILIDYKGGGLAGAFENSVTGIKLPHLVGTITNLDANEINRSLASIESELKRRQRLFNKAREASGESTVDIYKYQRMFRENVVDEPVSHLFIISDEFAELKSQQPEFMAQLISTARIGRSLGVHLILATQKPSGVVDAQIWSNTRFRVCLRVQEKEDSSEVIKCPDAAFLKQTGRFYFQVGYNEIFLLGQAAWAGGKYFPSEKAKKVIDTNISCIDNIGYVVRNILTKKKTEKVESQGEELNNIVTYLAKIAEEDKISCRLLWKPRIPDYINIMDLIKKYNYQKQANNINPIIGEFDAPSEQEQYLLTLPFTEKGNALLYGASGSGKENFITTIIYSSMLYYSPSEVNYYIIDFGSESLKMFRKCPLVGDIANIETEEKIKNLFKMVEEEMEVRKDLLVEYNGDLQNYNKNSGKSLPSIIVIINNYETFLETFPNYEENLNSIGRDCTRYGIYFLLACSTPNGVKFKTKQNFNQTFVLQQNSDDDYTSILGNVYKKYPSKTFGRGIIKDGNVYEFQTAYVSPKEKITDTVVELSERLNTRYPERARKVPTLPEIVNYETIKDELAKDNKLIIGIEKETLKPYKYDLFKNYVTLVSGNNLLSFTNFTNAMIKQVLHLYPSRLLVFNADEMEIRKNDDANFNCISEAFESSIDALHQDVENFYNQYVENKYDKKIFADTPKVTIMIVGLISLNNKLGMQGAKKLAEIIEKGKDLGILNLIIVETSYKLKKMEFESWYKASVDNNNGIWIGGGIGDQFTIKVATRIKEEITDEFCAVVYQGKPVIVKYVSDFNIEDSHAETIEI